jgi:site-specific DNA-methyltransferase (adenine-specific)
MSNEYFEADDIVIHKDDILTTRAVKSNSIDLIITSPPYNVDIQYNSHDDKMSYDMYLEFSEKWLARCHDFAKEDGRFCLNIPLDKNKGGQQSVCADLTTIAKRVGWKYHATIIWNEQNISRRTAWGSFRSASAPYVIAPVEVIVVLYKENWKKTSGSGESDITKEDFMSWTNAVWAFGGESKKRVGHPAPFPIELPKRCIHLFSFVGDTILDPFAGSGTTLIACALTGRKGIGIEIDEGYCKVAKKRLLSEAKLNQCTFEAILKRKSASLPRVKNVLRTNSS